MPRSFGSRGANVFRRVPRARGPPEEMKIIRVARCRGTPWRAPTVTAEGDFRESTTARQLPSGRAL